MRTASLAWAAVLACAEGAGSGARPGAGRDGATLAPDASHDAVADATPDTAPGPSCGLGCRMVMRSMDVPDGDEAAAAFACDVDGDGDAENALGAVIGLIETFNAGGVTVQQAVDGALGDGDLLVLWQLTAADLNADDAAVLRSWTGVDPDGDPTDNFSGFEELASAPDSPRRNTLLGSLAQGVGWFANGTLTFVMPLYPDVPPLPIELAAAQVHGTFSDAPSIEDGVACGGLPEDSFEEDVIPAIATLVNSVCVDNPSGTTCTALRPLFDTDSDGSVTAAEVGANAFLRELTAPDLDLFLGDASDRIFGQDCTFSKETATPDDPTCLDAISLGIGHTAVGANFTPPDD